MRLGQLLEAAATADTDALHRSFVGAGLIEPDRIGPEELASVMAPWTLPLRVAKFSFERGWLQREVRSWSDPRGPGARLQRHLHVPTRYLLVQRVAFGLLGVLTSLNATVAVRAEVDRWLRGTPSAVRPDVKTTKS
jgi:hypothetical protein